MLAVALCGLRGVGKDTACKILSKLASEANLHPIVLRFSDSIDNCVRDCFELSSYDEYQEFASSSIQYESRLIPNRKIIGRLSEHFRKINSDIFIQGMDYNFNKFTSEENFIIIPDLQFKREIIWSNENNITLIKLKKKNTYLNTLIDENDIADFLCDFIVENDFEKEDLERRLLEVFVELRAKNLHK